MSPSDGDLLAELTFLIGNKMERFYLKYWLYLEVDINKFILLAYQVLESIPAFEINTDDYAISRDKIQQKLFNELNDSREFGISKALSRIQQKYDLSFEKMKAILIKFILMSYQLHTYPGMVVKRGMSN